MSDRTNGNGVVRMALNVPAVERLIAGDTELELFLRQQVKAQVFDNAIGNIMSTPEIKRLVDDFKAKVDGVFREECSKEIGTIKHEWGGRETVTLNPKVKALLDQKVGEIVEPMVAKLVQDKVKQTIDTWCLLSEEKIAAALNQNIEKRINDGINARIAAAAANLKG